MNRFGQPVEIDEGDFSKGQLDNMREVVRPVGPWRFLTPIDTVQAGDLFRIVADGPDDDAAYNVNWSPVNQAYSGHLIGKPLSEMSSNWEVIRALEHGYTVPMFDLPPPDDAEEDDDE